jgi:beta-glucanase (GH16 family)
MAIGDTINTSTLTLTLDDEFSSFTSSPDGSSGLWRTSLKNGDRTLAPNGEEEYYADSSVGVNPFSDQNGVLDVQATPGSNPLGLPYNSGAITTEDSFNQLYGYFEIDAELPAGQGLWPAFWMIPANGSWPPELDAFEVLGNNPSELYFSTHSGVQPSETIPIAVANTSSGFNLYGVMWSPQTVSLYINNIEVASMPTPPDMDIPMYLEANLAVGGYWPGDPNASTVFPANMLVNYIRAYAYPGTTGGNVYDTSPSQNAGAAATAPVVTAPATLQATSGYTVSFGNVALASSWPGGFFSITISDNHGLLETAATSDVFASGEGTTSLTLTGNLAPLNAALATLSYEGQTPGSEWIWLLATDPQGLQGYTHVVATDLAASVAPVIIAPASAAIAAGSAQPLGGISVSDSLSGAYTVTASDSTGTLSVTGASGLTVTGAGTKSLKLTGSRASVNAGLASLSYIAAPGVTSDVVAFSATDASGAQGAADEAIAIASSYTPPAAGAPAIGMPTTVSLAPGSTKPLTGISVSDSVGGAYTVIVSDGAGTLNAAAASGVIATGGGTGVLTLSGDLAAINADLTSLTYQAGAATGTDWLWVSATNDANQQTDSHAVLSVAAAAPCFCAGTRIATANGPVPVEALRIGDLVRTAANGWQPIRWIGTRRVPADALNHLSLPVRIRRHALACNVPARDLFVSPDHAICEGGMLIHAWRLINGASITQEPRHADVSYFHLELERHAVIFAEDCPAESFLDEACRARFDNAAGAPPSILQPPCLPRLEDGYALERIRTRLNRRAGLREAPAAGALRGRIDEAGPAKLRGWAQHEAAPETPVELIILAGGAPLARRLANRYRPDLRAAGLGSGCHGFEFSLPPGLPTPITVRRAADGAPLAGS